MNVTRLATVYLSVQVVRQIPSEEIMKIARNIDRMQGLLFQDKA